MKQNYESGRTMVEMLGTLAIIGVLSIGGIMGYSHGMNKWRANVTINDINLRAIDLLSQLSQGHIPTLDAWDITGTAKYPILLNLDDAPTNYYIKVEQVPFEVCNMIADMMPEDVEILVDNDMQECAKGYNTLDFSYLGFGEQCGDSVCGTCQKCENESCVPITDYEQKCTSNGKFGWCIGGVCEPDTMCNCGENQYCADTNESACEPHPSGNCKDFNFRTVNIDGTTYYISNGYIASWWDNASACKALGKNMINHNEIAQACTQADDIECSTYGAKLTSLGKALYSEIGNGLVWSSIVNGCQASYVTLSDNPRIHGNPRANYHRFAVCR